MGIVIALAALLLLVITQASWEAIRTVGLGFFTGTVWDPEPSHRKFGALPFAYGTVATSFIAMLIAVPLGISAAVFMSEIASRRVRRTGAFLVEMLAAIPSVIYGFWGLFVLAPQLQKIYTFLGGPNQGGTGIMSAGIILSIMILPYIVAISYDVCRAVPTSQRDGAYALGATRWQMIRDVLLPFARPGIIGGCFLALGRALGETMAVTMLIGNKTDINFSPFAMGNSIASVIANEFTEATYDLYLSALAELGLLLLLVSIIVNSTARFMLWHLQNNQSRATTPSSMIAHISKLFAAPWRLLKRCVCKCVPTPASAAIHDPVVTHRRSERKNRIITVVLGLALLTAIGPLLFIFSYLLYSGISGINWEFFVNLPAPVGTSGGGMANAFYGSFILVSLATLMSVPIGLLAAIHLAEFRMPRLNRTVRFISDLVNGIPSIVIGIFAYAVVVKPMGHFSGWAGSFALAIIMLPIIIRVSEETLKLIPITMRDASAALGARQYQTILYILLPAALPAFITGVFLAVARIAGETAPLLLTASSNQFWPTSPNDFTPSLPVYIFTYAVSPYEDWHHQAWAAALSLVTIVVFLNFSVRLFSGKRVVSVAQGA